MVDKFSALTKNTMVKDKGIPEAEKQYRLTGGSDQPAISNGNSWSESEVGGKADVTAKIKARIDKYLDVVNALTIEYYKANDFTFETPPMAVPIYGPTYAKIVKLGHGVHTFIRLSNGDILKAATYKAPAKNGVRGNIWADDIGASAINHFGAKYLK